jgi:hypothetical protein
MNATEMRSYFDILQDKTNSPWFSDAEKDEFLYDVIYGYINDFIGDGDTPPSLEKNKGALQAISTLIKRSTGIAIPSTGILTDTLINAQIGSDTNIHAIAFELTTGEPVHFVRHNDAAVFEQNTYKAGTSTSPNYTIYDSSYQFYPKEAYTDVIATVIVEPTAITDLPVYKHREQVAKAMAKTGFVTESEALIMMGNQEGVG